MEPTTPPPAKKFCAARCQNSTETKTYNCQFQKQQDLSPHNIKSKGRNEMPNSKVKLPTETSNGSIKKVVASVPNTYASKGFKVKKIKLRTHDGKNLGEISVRFLPAQTTCLNGKLLKLSKATTVRKPVKSAATLPVASVEKKVQSLNIQPNPKIATGISPISVSQPVPATLAAPKLPTEKKLMIVQKEDTLKTFKQEPTVISTLQHKENTTGSEKKPEHCVSQTSFAPTTQALPTVQASVTNGQSNTTVTSTVVPISTTIKAQRNLVPLDDNENPKLISNNSPVIKEAMQKTMPRVYGKSKSLSNVQKQVTVTQVQCADASPKFIVAKCYTKNPKTVSFNVEQNGSNPPELAVVLPNNNQKPLVHLPVKLNGKTTMLKQQAGLPQLSLLKPANINQTNTQNKIKLGQSILVYVTKNNLASKNVLVAPQKNLSGIPIQNVIPIFAKCKNPVKSNDKTLEDVPKSVRTDSTSNVETAERLDCKTNEETKVCSPIKPVDTSVPVSIDKKVNEHINERIKLDVSNDNPDEDPVKKDRLSIIGEALNSITDAELREKALKALADCGISIARQIPIPPPQPTKTVHERPTQTEVFGLLDKQDLVLVKEEVSELKRISQVEDTSAKTVSKQEVGIQVEHEISQNETTDWDVSSWPPKVLSPSKDILDFETFFNELCSENPGANKVKNILSPKNSLCQRIITHIQQDYQSLKHWDEDGMLNIHKAVVNNDISALERIVLILKACKENIDVETACGKTSLELAISLQSSPAIVKALLTAGAEPISPRLVHDSAVVLASRISSPHLVNLLSYVKEPSLLNNTDSQGLAPLHYCAMHANMEGVKALLEAGADVNLRDNRSGRTAFFHATEYNHTQIGQLLLEHGADVTIENFAGQTVVPLLTYVT